MTDPAQAFLNHGNVDQWSWAHEPLGEDIGWIDVWTEFTPYSTTTGHYSDNQHQTQLGSEVIAGRVFGAFCG